MRTPAGTECPYYYEDFHRGRDTQECRLIDRNPESLPWSPDVCGKCAVPGIVQANGSPDLRLTVTVRKRFGLMKTVDVTARCAKHDQAIEDPYVGCQACADDLRTLLG